MVGRLWDRAEIECGKGDLGWWINPPPFLNPYPITSFLPDLKMAKKLVLRAINIISSNISQSLTFYSQILKMRLIGHSQNGPGQTFTFLQGDSASSTVALILHGPPFSGWMESFISAHGPMLSHLTFAVENINDWAKMVSSSGDVVLEAPDQFSSDNRIYFRDPAGTILELTSQTDPSTSLSRSLFFPRDAETTFALSHTNITCQDIVALEKFYTKALGLKVVYDAREEGMIFLADPEAKSDEDHELFLLELFGPPGLWEPDIAFLEEHRAGLQYLCFSVTDVDRAFDELRSKGVQFHLLPTDIDGNRIAFFKDPNGIDIEILFPLPRNLLS
jgi:catechol 2,3-dioxygenase-like lactoylglutathione lyase family enzyme